MSETRVRFNTGQVSNMPHPVTGIAQEEIRIVANVSSFNEDGTANLELVVGEDFTIPISDVERGSCAGQWDYYQDIVA